MRRVAVLRPEPGASATVERARQRGLEAFAIPLFEVVAIEWEAPDPGGFDALLLTSANAVRFGGAQLERLRALPVHAVGQATAAAARDAGFDIASAGDAGVERLLGSVEPGLRLLHLCGEDRRDTGDGSHKIAQVVIYRSRPIGDADVGAAEGCVALIHSPRAGARFAGLVDQAGIDQRAIAVAAISAAAAEAAGEGWAAVESAETPDDDAVLALAERLCNKLGRQ